MKLFKTKDIKILKDCQSFFNIELPSALLVKRFDKFIAGGDGTNVQFWLLMQHKAKFILSISNQLWMIFGYD